MGSVAKLFATVAFFSLAIVFTWVMVYCCVKTYKIVYGSGNYRSDRTNRMQLTLLKSLVAQTVCLVVCYPLPLGIIIFMYFFGSAYIYSTIVLLHYVMYLYAPLNYAMIFVFATQFSTELFGWKQHGRRNSRTKPYTGIHFVSTTG
ncbi:hypothetical protein AAVH_11991 [Aphelenchoides avenae]|nr:hypothetical protein AAVH_11991 [Aphelenchus avenae]